jgi:hypothetical protein
VSVRLIVHHVQVSHDERGPVGALSLSSSDDTGPTAVHTGMNRNSGDLEVRVGDEGEGEGEGEGVGVADACVNTVLPSRPTSPRISRSACSPGP